MATELSLREALFEETSTVEEATVDSTLPDKLV